MGRILAIDYGKKRVGLAVTDELKMIANGLTTVAADKVMDYLKDYCSKEHVELIVVGDPRQMNNEESGAVSFVRPFVKKLRKAFPDIPVVMEDERFTSQMAFQTMIDAGLGKKKRRDKALVDKISATLILQSYMENKDM